MEKAKYTLGPWEVKEDTVSKALWITNDAVSGDICDLYFRSNEECIQYPNAVANAHLIASAPELLEAIEKIKDYWDEGNFRRDGVLWNLLNTAIAKAEGRE